MTIYAVGDEPESYTTALGSISGSTTAKDTNSRGGVLVNTASAIASLYLKTSISECWFRGLVYAASAGSSSTNMSVGFYNSSSSKDVVRIIQTGGTGTWKNYEIQYNSSGSSYTTIGSFPFKPRTVTAGSPNELTVYLKLGSSGVVKVFSRNCLVFSSTGNYTAVDSNFDYVRLGGAVQMTWAGVIVSDSSVLTYTTDHLSPNGTGSSSGWTNASGGSATTGDLIDSTGAPTINTATYIKTNTAGNRLTFNYDNSAVLSASRAVKGLQIAAAGIIESGSAISSVSFCIRHSGVNYTRNNLGFGTTIKGYSQVMETDPGGSAWTTTTINALEIGVVAA